MTHTHRCSCGALVPCDGDLERNHDGWPATICRLYHLPSGAVAEVRCEACEELIDRCDEVTA